MKARFRTESDAPLRLKEETNESRAVASRRRGCVSTKIRSRSRVAAVGLGDRPPDQRQPASRAMHFSDVAGRKAKARALALSREHGTDPVCGRTPRSAPINSSVTLSA